MNKRNIIITIVIVALLGVGIGMNYYWEQNQVMLDDDGDPIPKATSQTAPTAPPPPLQKTQTIPPPPSVFNGNGNLPSEVQFGNPKAQTTVALGYSIDPTLQINPTKVQNVVQSLTLWAQSHPDVRIKVVSVDLPKDQLTDPSDGNLPLGISVNGKPVAGLTSNPGEGFSADQVPPALSSVH